MKTATFAQNLLSMQTELLHFAYKLTADREEANDLLQETSLKALDNEEKYVAETNFKGWYNPQIEMFAHFKTKSSFHKTKGII